MSQVVVSRPRPAPAPHPAPSTTPERTRVRLAPVLLTVGPGLALAWWSGLATTWDGSSFLFRILQDGRPEVLHGRVGSVIWQAPAVLASQLGASVGVTRALFSLGFVVVPLIALWLAWLVVRDADPRLFACAACGIVALASPAQAFFVGEMLISLQLGWVVWLTAATGGATPWGRRLLVPVSLLIIATHPVAAGILVIAAGLFLLRWWTDGRRSLARWEIAVGGLLTVAALARVLVINGYERENTGDLALNVAIRAFGSQGWLLAAALGSIGAAVIVLAAGLRSRRASWAPFVLLAAGAAGLGVWAADVSAWEDAINWRIFDGALMLPALVGVIVVVRLSVRRTENAPRRCTRFAAACGAVASVVLVIQSVGWHDAREDLRAELRATPSGCVAFDKLQSVRSAPIGRHWATALLVLEEQGLDPRVVALRRKGLCDRYARTGDAELWPWGDAVDRADDGRFQLPAAG